MNRRRSSFAAGSLLLCGLLAGCASGPPRQVERLKEEDPVTAFVAAPMLSADVKRVAVLPLVADDASGNLVEGCEALEPVLNAELIKTRRFETICISPSALQFHSGQVGWTGNETLPSEFLSTLRDAYGCDAVLFCQLTRFQAYAPLAVGWRMKLVDTRTKKVLWATDELFDASRPEPGGLHRYRLFGGPSAPISNGRWEFQNSPARFGQYTLARLFVTLPAR